VRAPGEAVSAENAQVYPALSRLFWTRRVTDRILPDARAMGAAPAAALP
jgi:hypothetical protein